MHWGRICDIGILVLKCIGRGLKQQQENKHTQPKRKLIFNELTDSTEIENIFFSDIFSNSICFLNKPIATAVSIKKRKEVKAR
jgi:hypothetical protein